MAVRCRLRSAFPLGSHLSGGLDSSSITCVARDLLAREEDRALNTYSIVFDEVPGSDERPFINAVVDEGGVEPHYVRGDAVTPFTDIKRVDGIKGNPFVVLILLIGKSGCCPRARGSGSVGRDHG